MHRSIHHRTCLPARKIRNAALLKATVQQRAAGSPEHGQHDGRGSEDTHRCVDSARDEQVLEEESELEWSGRTGVGRTEDADHHAAPRELLDGLRSGRKVIPAPRTPPVFDEAWNGARLMRGAECNHYRIGLKAVVLHNHRARIGLERLDLSLDHANSPLGQA